MSNSTAAVAAPITFSGGDAPPVVDYASDRGDLVVSAPANPVIEEVATPEIGTPAPVADVIPAPVVETPPTNTTDRGPQNKKEFLSRLEVKNRKIRALEEQVRAQTTAAPVAEETAPAAAAPAVTSTGLDIQATRIKAMQLMIDGDFEAAAKLQAEADAVMYAQIRQEVAAEASKAAVEQIQARNVTETVDQAADALIADYEFLDTDSPNHDKATVRLINNMVPDFVDEGHSPAEALRLAADEVLRFKYPQLFTATAEIQTPAPVIATRKVDPVASLTAAAKQPGNIEGTSTRSMEAAPIDIFKISEKDFGKLSEVELSRLRGDTL